MGCVVFHYDMVGYADSKQIAHRAGFTDAEAELRLQSFMGLQTCNSIRALDFLVSLPDVDPKRIGVTGASGGGTQTFILCAIDDRPAAAFPAVMVSTGMQGGCICENCSYLRVGTGNIELAGLFAPKPLGMTGADDAIRRSDAEQLWPVVVWCGRVFAARADGVRCQEAGQRRYRHRGGIGSNANADGSAQRRQRQRPQRRRCLRGRSGNRGRPPRVLRSERL